MDPLDKMDPRRVKSAPAAIELNRHFRAETNLSNLQCKKNIGELLESSLIPDVKCLSQ